MKTKALGLRMSADLEAHIIAYAKERKWTKSFAICEILNDFFGIKEK